MLDMPVIEHQAYLFVQFGEFLPKQLRRLEIMLDNHCQEFMLIRVGVISEIV